MKTQSEINSLLNAFQNKYNFSVGDQGTENWLKAKLGVISASNASCLVAKVDSETRKTYMADLVAEICTGMYEELNFKQIEWGKAHEPAARSAYEWQTNQIVTQQTFVFKDETFREGCSPDATIENKGIEIKCPFNPTNYVKFLVSDTIKTEYHWQVQYSMRVLECDTWDVVQYHPNMKKSPLKIFTVEKDLKKQQTLEDAVPQFISDMDKMLAKIGVNFGEQWI